MSKGVSASCQALAVKVGGVTIPGIEILSEGKGSSQGIILVDQDKGWYIPNTTPDTKATIEKLITGYEKLSSAITKIAETLTLIGTGMTGASTAPPPTLPTNVTAINALVTEINLVKTEFTTLKDNLI